MRHPAGAGAGKHASIDHEFPDCRFLDFAIFVAAQIFARRIF
jgi:hypothetical protein